MMLSLWENQNIQRQLSGKIQLERRLAGQMFLTDAVVEEEREYRETLRAFRDAYRSFREMVKGHWSLIRQGAKQRYELEELSGQDVSRMHVTDDVSDGTGEREQREIRQMYPIDHDWNDAGGQIQEDGLHRLPADNGQHGVNAANMTESEHRQHVRQIQETVNVLQGIIDIQSGQEQEPTSLTWQTGTEEPRLYEQESETEERVPLQWNPVSDHQISDGQGSKSEESILPAKNPASDQRDSDGKGSEPEYRQILQMLEADYSHVDTGQGHNNISEDQTIFQSSVDIFGGQEREQIQSLQHDLLIHPSVQSLQDSGHDYISVFLDRYSEWMSESDPRSRRTKRCWIR